MDNDDFLEISGEISAVIYQNEENGYTVLRLDTADGEVTVVGCIPFAAPGEELSVGGEWTKHHSHGDQFKAEWAERSLPREANAIYEYLASGTVKGVGPATAMLIVAAFGDDSLDVLESEPGRLAEVKGIGAKKAREISEHFRKQLGVRLLMEFLARYDLPMRLAVRLFRFYGNDALGFLHLNPYVLADDHIGGRFSDADSLALSLGFEGDSPQRIAAAILFELNHNLSNGHCFIPRGKLVDATTALIEVPRSDVDERLGELLEKGDIAVDMIAGEEGCYLTRMYEAETYVTARLLSMAATVYSTDVDFGSIISDLEERAGITYAPMQRETLSLAATRQVMVITGGPGTGKTTSVRAILALFDKLGVSALCAAPTGRAAKRMSELSGKEASTIHRLLEAGFSESGGETFFRRDESDPLRTDAVIIDETSMVDLTLMRALLAAMPQDCRLVMVGDASQLPPIGPGSSFLDIIRSGAVPVVRLNEIFRQKSESRIVRNAHMINNGEHPNLTENTGDFFFLRRRNPDDCVETILELCAKRLPENMGVPSTDIQVLTPTRRYETGTQTLNVRLQQALNPPTSDKKERKFGEITFREGDRVMQTRNNYDIIWEKADGSAGAGIFNGDVGRVLRIDNSAEIITVDFEDRLAEYAFEQLLELEHAFAMTVHKSQGSEYRAVILSASRGAQALMARAVLYTAVTRAKELLIIVGEDAVVARMIENDRQQKRYSGLRARLASGLTLD